MDVPASIEVAKHTLLSGGIILAVGIAGAFIAQRTKIPDVAVFPIVGICIGPEVLGLINIEAYSALNQIIFLFGASYILFDGGASLRFDVLRRVWITIVTLATVGVIITAFLTGIVAYSVFDMPLGVALLLGAALSSTDPATLIPIFQQVRIRDRVAQTVVSESAFNDATGAITTFAVLAILIGGGDFSLVSSALDLGKQLVVGICAGAVFGYFAAFFVGHERWAFLAEYAPMVTLAAVIGAYFAADGLQASGFTAVFVFGMVLGNRKSLGFEMDAGDEKKLQEYVTTTAFMMRVFIFTLLGTQVNFALMSRYLWGGIILVVIFMLVVRPATVFVCALPDRRARWSFNEMLFMCWTRETGVIPAALAGLLLGMKAPEAPMIASVTFIAILMTILIQAPTTKWLGDRLGLLEGE